MKAPHEKKDLTKLFVTLIPIVIVLLLIINNFLVDRTFTKSYEIGGKSDNYLSPSNRISEKATDVYTYRNLTGHLVYFDVNIPTGTETITIETRLQPNLPNKSIMSLGARDQVDWHYKYKQLNFTTEDDGWYITETTFNIKEDNLTIINNKLSFVFNVPHLNQNETLNYTIPIDYIKITMYKPSILK